MDITNPDVEAYAAEHSSAVVANLDAVATRTRADHSDAGMMVGRLEGAFLEMLVNGLQARRVLEIGTFTGYSAISMASALADGGHIITCEVDPEHAAYARQHIAASGYADRIELREGPALETVRGLEGPFEFVFIDADKSGYIDYYETVLPKLSAHGLIAADNTLQGGDVLDPGSDVPPTVAIRQFNDHVLRDARARCVLLPVRDGVTLVRRVGTAA